MGIYKFGNNTYPRRIRRRSNLGHFFGKKIASYGLGNTVVMLCTTCNLNLKISVFCPKTVYLYVLYYCFISSSQKQQLFSYMALTYHPCSAETSR